MKKALEAAVVAAVLALGAFVVRSAIARREAASRPLGDPALRAGPDTATPGAPYEPKPPASVDGLPMLKLTRPPKRAARAAAVPPPSSR